MGNDYSYGAAVLRPGTSLNGGYYVIESKIGEGGFGITYKAVQKKLNRTVCIKEYFLMGRCARDTQNNRVVPNPSDTALYNKYRDSFTKEAQTLGELHHPGIVEIIDVFDENGTSYMVMPFIEGESLQSIVERQGPLPHSLAINYMAQISDAVSYIHRRHILHRDIKPANIMITADYKAVLIDFGSAREFEHDKTQAQTSLLTLGYAPLEQYTTTSRKGSYTDIYAMGATFYFILTGRVPLAAAARVTERMPEPAELNLQIPSSVNHAIMKAMELQSQDRYQSVEEFTRDLQVRGSAQPTTSGPTRLQSPRPTMTAPQPKRNKKWIVWMIVGIITLLVTVAAIALAIPRGNKAMDSVTDSTPANSTGDEYIGNDADDQDSHGRGGDYMKPEDEEIYKRQEKGEKVETRQPTKVNTEYETPTVKTITRGEAEPVEPEINPNVLYKGKRNKNNDSHTSNQAGTEGSPGSSYVTGSGGISYSIPGRGIISYPPTPITFTSAERINCTFKYAVWVDKNGNVVRVEYISSSYSDFQLREKGQYFVKRIKFSPLSGDEGRDELQKGTVTITFRNTP